LSDDQHEELHSVLDSDRSSVEPLLDQLRMANETFSISFWPPTHRLRIR
jgi:hypothetical protein